MKKSGEDKTEEPGNKMLLQLFVSGMSPRSMEAVENIQRICQQYIPDGYQLEIIDIYKNPVLAREQQIIFCPSLIKKHPSPKKILVGSLEDTEKVLKALGLNKAA